MLPKETLAAGSSAEKKVYDECIAQGKSCFFANELGQKMGYDIIIDGTKYDVKNTFKIYFGNDEGEHFKVRNPFRLSCEATHYWINDSHTNKCYYNGPIFDYLLKYFFTSELTLNIAKKYLNDRANKKNKEGWNQVKDKFKSLCHDDVHVNYELDPTTGNISYFLKTNERNNYEKKFGVPIY